MTTTAQGPSAKDKILFVGCFLALIATAFGFVVRAQLLNTWQIEFDLTDTQKGEIAGVGLWPFAISIVLFSLIIDRIGYGRAMIFAFVCHVASAILTITADSYWDLYIGTFVVALGNGTVEAVINPVVATMFRREKTKWLNILHAGWPGGLVLGGLLALLLGDWDWQWKVGLLLLPTAGYGAILAGCKFPVSERVEAGVSHREMLREVGGLGMLIVLALISIELGRVFKVDQTYALITAVVLSAGFGFYVGGLGRGLFVFLLLVMIPLATTELGVDSFSAALLEGQMSNPIWVLIYTSAIMMVLRLFAGPLVHRLSPLGLLAVCSIVAAIGLYTLSTATEWMILVAATIYGVGKSFFWPTMLGVVAEKCPRGGALTLNAIAGVGMLGVGVLGAPVLGLLQNDAAIAQLEAKQPELVSEVVKSDLWVFGSYDAVQPKLVAALADAPQEAVKAIQASAGQATLATAAIFPLIMLVCYAALALWFKSQGGYQAEVLTGHAAEDEKFTGGTAGPGEG